MTPKFLNQLPETITLTPEIVAAGNAVADAIGGAWVVITPIGEATFTTSFEVAQQAAGIDGEIGLFGAVPDGIEES